ncbi:MAG: polysaccharide biosynthesis protein [Prevotella sp.]|nr:polysaccharide biosynthesis protein [Prevotella sp.]
MNILHKLANWYFTRSALPYWGILIVDCIIIFLSSILCYMLDHGVVHSLRVFGLLTVTMLLLLIPYIIGIRMFRTYTAVMRYTSFADLYRVAMANVIGFLLVVFIVRGTPIGDKLIALRMMDLVFTVLLATAMMCLVRILIKTIYEYIQRTKHMRRVFIYGVKNGGMGIARAIQTEQPRKFQLVGFVSDASDMSGKMLMGVNVYFNDERLIEEMKKRHVKTLLVSPLKQEALAGNPVMVDRLMTSGIKVYTLNSAVEWDGKSDIASSQMREVQIEDLLPREEIEIDLDAVKELIRGKRVMVTGSAGSIGSEIVRQLAQFDPELMVLVDQAETPQHDIRLMMAREFPNVKAESIVTTICNQTRMEAVFKMYRPDFVFHAAAYKHVPMMEDNPCEAIQNNVEGTKVLADLSVKYGVKKFVMISTDKAVNPTNVMGCSKRICEIYVQSLNRVEDTQFVTTRFGNVLGSNGSVIPLFREQIRRGGPVTVTHPNIYRYFMLIPEACRLVLEAGTMGNGGEIFVFDMGAPVKIADLAKRMIMLSGAKNVEIKYTGLRDGEKLYEEVLDDGERTKPTFNKKIKIAEVREYDFNEVSVSIGKLIEDSYNYDAMHTVRQMKDIVPEFKSNHSVYEVLDKERT